MLDRSKLFFTALIEPTGEIEMTPRIGRVEEYLRRKFSKGFDFIVRTNATRDEYEVTGDKCPTEEAQFELRLVLDTWIADFMKTLDCYGDREYEFKARNSASDFSERLPLIMSPAWGNEMRKVEFLHRSDSNHFRACADVNTQDLVFLVPDFAPSATRNDVRLYIQDYFLTLLIVFMRLQLGYHREVMLNMLTGDWIAEHGFEMAGNHILESLDRADEALVNRTPSSARLQELSDYSNFDFVHKCLNGGLRNRHQDVQELKLREMVAVIDLSRPWTYENRPPELWSASEKSESVPEKVPTVEDRPTMPYLPPGRDVQYVEADNMYMVAARQFTEERSACSWWPTGAVLVKNGVVIRHGANSGHFEPLCPRLQNNCPTGEGYDLCQSICQQHAHAEVAAIEDARASGADTQGADLYLFGHWWLCKNCWDSIIAAGIRNVYLLKNAHKAFTRESRIAVAEKIRGKLAAGESVTAEDAIWQL